MVALVYGLKFVGCLLNGHLQVKVGQEAVRFIPKLVTLGLFVPVLVVGLD